MTNEGLVFGAATATVVLAIANAWGWLAIMGPTNRPFRKISDHDGDDKNDTLVRARAIVAYLTANRSDRSKAPSPS